MAQKTEYFSCGLNQYNQLTHNIEDGIFHKMIIPENLKIKKMKCGRSHILVTTFDNELYSYGANYSGQCGVGHRNNLTQWTQCYSLLTNNQNNNQNNNNMKCITNVKDFSCGWIHSLCITENGKSLYFTGSSVTALPTSDYFININHIIPLKKENNNNTTSITTKKEQFYTKVISGDHICSVIVNNEIIYYINQQVITINVLQITGTFINEITATNHGFFLTNQIGELYAFKCQLSNDLNLTKINLNGFVKCLTSAHTHQDISYQLNNKKYFTVYGQPQQSKKECDLNNNNEIIIIQPLYYGCLIYKKKERKLFALGSNADYTLGLDSKNSFEELTEVKTMNEYLEKNQEMDIEEIIEGCDFTVLVVKEKETRDLKLFFEKLKSCCCVGGDGSFNLIVDVTFVF